MQPGKACDEEQWRHFSGLCGSWHGKWHRYTVDAEGALRSTRCFRAVCNPEASADGRSVHHVNRYEPGAEPPGAPPGRLVGGLYEVDHGIYDAANFRAPFGPHSRAVYLAGGAVIASASLVAGPMVAAELIAMLPRGEGVRRQRRRLVATWRAEGEATEARLASVTCIAEVEEAKDDKEGMLDAAMDPAGSGAAAEGPVHGRIMRGGSAVEQDDVGDCVSWHGSRIVVGADGTVVSETPHTSDCGRTLPMSKEGYVLPDGVCAWLPSALQLKLEGQVTIGMGWHAAPDIVMRMAAVYSDCKFVHAVQDQFHRSDARAGL